MIRKKILIADNFEHEINELRTSLNAAGFEVRIIDNVDEILPVLQQFKPHLVIIETRIPELNLKSLIKQIKNQRDFTFMPIILTGTPRTIDEKVNLFKFDIDEFISKPHEPEETIVRIETLLKEAKLAREKVPVTSGGFNGSLSEMTLVDLLQTLDVGKKTGVIKLRNDGKEGFTFVSDGEVVNATLDMLEPKQALLRMFTWTNGVFSVKMQPHDAEKQIYMTTQELISEGITRQYRWKKLIGDLPSLQSVAQKVPANAENLNKDERLVVELVDNQSRLIDIIETSPFDDIKALRILKKLFERSVVKVVENSFSNHTRGDLAPTEFIDYAVAGKSEDRVESAFAKILKHTGSVAPPQFDRRKADRRVENRTETDRRHGYRSHPGNICLKKSELIMLRNKLIAEIQQKL